MSLSSRQTLSSEEIRNHYFGEISSIPQEGDRLPLSPIKELTPTARYIIRETRKELAQRELPANLEKSAASNTEDELRQLVEYVESREGEHLSERERTVVVASLSASLQDYDILNSLIENPEVNDIIIRSFRDISIQTDRKNIQTDLQFSDHETYKSFVENLLKRAGKSCTTATPVVDAAIDNRVRACVTHESFSPVGSGPMVTLRIARHHNISLEALAAKQLAPGKILEYLAALVTYGGQTLLIAGEVGTGKTTLLQALVSRVPQDEAILIIEDTHEIIVNRSFCRTLLTREANTEGSGRISPALAIRTGMRMAMNRLVLGEMRDAEAAEAFIDVCSSGHSGMSTIHARSARDALSRLELFLLRAQGNVSIETIRRQIANAVSVVVFLGVDKETQRRHIVEVVEIGSYADGAIQYSSLFSFSPNQSSPQWRRESGVSQFQRALSEQNIQLPSVGKTLLLDPDEDYQALGTDGEEC